MVEILWSYWFQLASVVLTADLFCAFVWINLIVCFFDFLPRLRIGLRSWDSLLFVIEIGFLSFVYVDRKAGCSNVDFSSMARFLDLVIFCLACLMKLVWAFCGYYFYNWCYCCSSTGYKYFEALDVALDALTFSI